MSDEPAHILVVDDNEMNRDMLSRRLQKLSYNVEMAENGERCLEMMRTFRYDLVMLDIMMPKMNGYEVLETAKADSA
ncbi:MAG TPA: response regulator, partial [Aggregatilineales bacterium]|nr:response regulator [Aggregatilineales bacterium]